MQNELRFCLSSQQGKGQAKFGTVVSIGGPKIEGYGDGNKQSDACFVKTIPEGAICDHLGE